MLFFVGYIRFVTVLLGLVRTVREPYRLARRIKPFYKSRYAIFRV